MAGRIRLKVRLDLPPKELTPNCRCHFMAKANKTKKYRSAAMETAMVAASEAGMSDPMDRASVKATFYCRDSRAMDADNALASLKAAFDGLADAGRSAERAPDPGHRPGHGGFGGQFIAGFKLTRTNLCGHFFHQMQRQTF